MVNIRGPSGKIEHMSSIMRSLQNRGDIDEHPLGGVKTDAHMRVKDKVGKANPSMYAVGPILRGEFAEAITIPAIRELTKCLSDNIMNDHVLSPKVT